MEHVTQRFGGLVAVERSRRSAIEPGSIVAMIGPNGAGKSTAFNLITGIYKPTEGTITFDGKAINGMATSDIAALGIARTFQNIRLFAFMSALDNVMTGEHARMKASLFDSLLHTPRQRSEERRVREKAREILRFVNLEKVCRKLRAQFGVRLSAPARDRSRAGQQPEAAAARRTRGRDEPARKGGLGRAHPAHPRHGRHRLPHRARHGAGHAALANASRCSITARRSPKGCPPRCATIRK